MKARLVVLVLLLALPALLLAALPPELVPYFAGIRAKESSGYPWSIYDNTTARSYRLPSRAAAETLAKDLIDRGHNLDLGLYQINWQWQQKRPGLTLANVFDPLMNESVAQQVLSEFYTAARLVYTNVADAIRMAIGAYNNGKVRVHNPKYVNAVYRLVGQPVPYSDEDNPPLMAGATPQPGTAPGKEEWGAGSELARWFPGAPSLAVLLKLADADTPADPSSADRSLGVLSATLLTVALLAALLLFALVVGAVTLKLLPLIAGSASLFAKRAAIGALLRFQRRIGSDTSRLARM